VINSGAITAGDAAIFASTANVTSSGAGPYRVGRSALLQTPSPPSPTTASSWARQAFQAGGAATITNASAIISTAGASGTAIKLSNAADTLALRTGSRIVGLVDMGFAMTPVTTVTVERPARCRRPRPLLRCRPSSISAASPTPASPAAAPLTPAVQAGNQLTTLDPTALAADRPTRLDGHHRRACRRWCKDASMTWRHQRTLRARQGLRHPLALKGSKNDR